MEDESLVYPSFTESKGTICPCIFCWKLIRFRSNDEIRYFGQKIKYFLQMFKLPGVRFQTQLFEMPFCPECVDLLRSMVSLYRRINGFEVKLAGHKNTLIQHLQKCTNLDPLAEENGKTKGIVELRRQLMEAMGLEPSEIEVETQVDADVLDFFIADEPASPLTAPFEDSYNFEADQTSGTDQEAIQVDTKPEVVVGAKFTLPENITLKDCFVRVSKISQEELVKYSSKITNPVRINKRRMNEHQKRAKIKPLPPETSNKKKTKFVRCSFRDPETKLKCKAGFRDQESVDRHIKRFHLKIKPVPPEASKKKMEKTFTRCSYRDPKTNKKCTRGFRDLESVDRHIKRFHLKLKEILPSRRKIHICQYCTYSSQVRGHVEKHTMRMHTGVPETICEICGEKFPTEYSAVKHKAQAHGEPYPFKCEDCDEGFVRKCQLVYHRYKHTGAWKYKCEVCGRGTVNKATYLLHKQRFHDGWTYNHTCHVCGKRFHQLGQLNGHLRRHRVDRPYKCNFCTKAFRLAESLKEHLNSVHSEDRPFLCEECGAAFKLRKYLVVHMKSYCPGKRLSTARNRHSNMSPVVDNNPPGTSLESTLSTATAPPSFNSSPPETETLDGNAGFGISVLLGITMSDSHHNNVADN